MNIVLKRWIGVLSIGILLLPACSSDRKANNNIETNETPEAQQVIIHKSGAKRKRKTKNKKKTTQSTPKAIIKGAVSTVMGTASVVGIIECCLAATAAPFVLVVPPVLVATGFGVVAYKLAKSGYEDYVAKDETAQRTIEDVVLDKPAVPTEQ